MGGNCLGRSPRPPIRTFNPLFRMLKELDPMAENESVRELFIASIDVRIPTSAVMPMAMINAVKKVRNLLLLIDCSDSFTFSRLDICTDISTPFYPVRPHPLQGVTIAALFLLLTEQPREQFSLRKRIIPAVVIGFRVERESRTGPQPF